MRFRSPMPSRVGDCIEKKCLPVPAGDGPQWQADVFEGVHEGLVLAEIALPDEDEAFAMPAWPGKLATGDPASYEAALAGN